MSNLTMSNGNQLITLDNYAVLSPDRSTRLQFLEWAAYDVNLPPTVRENWRSVLGESALNDGECDGLHNDLSDTPVHIARSIRNALISGKAGVASLVPSSKRYYGRLVGAYKESTSIRAYASGEAKPFLEGLSAWRPCDGFLFSLLLSSHSTLTAVINVENMEMEELVNSFDYLAQCGDRISQLGGIEVGLRVLPEYPEIRPALMQLLELIRDDDTEGSESGFRLLSALFPFVDGELSRTRLLSEHPPFYRRLAALAQAALICRQTIDLGKATNSLCEWAASTRGGRHVSQSLADMRLEPRWYPDFSNASRIKSYFCGRIQIAASSYHQNITDDDLHDLILGENPESIKSQGNYTSKFLPGPLGGTEDCLCKMPQEVLDKIEVQLSADRVEISSFSTLLNTVPIFGIELNKARLEAKVRILGDTLLESVGSKDELLSILLGLAALAAITRNQALAEESRNLVRKCRRDAQYKLSAEEALSVSLVAAASLKELTDWKQFVGDCLTELTFGELEDREVDALQTNLEYLCHAVPELSASCSRADAALKALNGY